MMKFKNVSMVWQIACQSPLQVSICFHALVYMQEKRRPRAPRHMGTKTNVPAALSVIATGWKPSRCLPIRECGQTVVHSHNGIQHSNENESSTATPTRHGTKEAGHQSVCVCVIQLRSDTNTGKTPLCCEGSGEWLLLGSSTRMGAQGGLSGAGNILLDRDTGYGMCSFWKIPCAVHLRYAHFPFCLVLYTLAGMA